MRRSQNRPIHGDNSVIKDDVILMMLKNVYIEGSLIMFSYKISGVFFVTLKCGVLSDLFPSVSLGVPQIFLTSTTIVLLSSLPQVQAVLLL